MANNNFNEAQQELDYNTKYFLNLLIPQQFQQNYLQDIQQLNKKNYHQEEDGQSDNIQDLNFFDEFTKFYQRNPKLNSFPDEGLPYIKNYNLLHQNGYFNWFKYIEQYMEFDELSEQFQIFVKHIFEDINQLDKFKQIQYDIDISQLDGQKLCILKNDENEFLIQSINEENLSKFNLSSVYTDKEYQKAEIKDCSYVYKIKKLKSIDAEFYKLFFASIPKNKKILFSSFLKQLYLMNQKFRTSYTNKIQKKINEEQQQHQGLQKQISQLDQYQSFLDLCFYFRTFQQNFSHFVTIEKEIDFFIKHSNILQKKTEDCLLIFQNNVDEIFQDCQEKKKKYIIESDCAICFSCEASQSNNVIYCSKCGQGAHVKCLGIKEAPENDFYCGSCPEEKRTNNIFCIFCKKKDFLLLKKDKEKRSNEVHYHLLCMLILKRWGFNNQTQLFGLDTQRNKAVCQICEKNEFKENLIQCVDCNKNLHPICSYKQGYYFDISKLEDQKFDNFVKGQFQYEVKVYCQDCDLKKYDQKILENSKQSYEKLIELNKHYRFLSACPSYYRQYIESDDYKNYKTRQVIKQLSQLNFLFFFFCFFQKIKFLISCSNNGN